MSHVDFKKHTCRMSILRNIHVALSNLRNAHVALSNHRNCHVPCHYLFRSHVACFFVYRSSDFSDLPDMTDEYIDLSVYALTGIYIAFNIYTKVKCMKNE